MGDVISFPYHKRTPVCLEGKRIPEIWGDIMHILGYPEITGIRGTQGGHTQGEYDKYISLTHILSDRVAFAQNYLMFSNLPDPIIKVILDAFENYHIDMEDKNNPAIPSQKKRSPIFFSPTTPFIQKFLVTGNIEKLIRSLEKISQKMEDDSSPRTRQIN